jgi:hypothetical protein
MDIANNVLHDIYISQATVRIMTSRMLRWDGYVVRVGEVGMNAEFWWGSHLEINHQEDRKGGESMLLKCTL